MAALLPLSVLALDYRDTSSRYKDAPFKTPEAAAISVLSNAGIMEGNPDGTFATARSINRAEFLKIGLLSQPAIAVSASDAAACFPDVRSGDWFSRYVCLGKNRGVVEGYADGSFRPGQTVTYAEGLKMLAELYEGDGDDSPWKRRCLRVNSAGICELHEDIVAPAGAPWYQVYVDWAGAQGLLLPLSIDFNEPLARGQAARLVAAFRADAEGELASYRQFEQGRVPSSRSSMGADTSSRPTSSSSSSSLQASSSSVSSVSSSVSSVSSSVSSLPDLPVSSHFLLLGARSKPVASAVFLSPLEGAYIRRIEVRFDRKVRSLSRVYIVDAAGTPVLTLSPDVTDSTDRNWKATSTATGATYLAKNAERVLAAEVLLLAPEEGGIVGETVEIDQFTIDVEGEWSGCRYTSAAQTFTFPMHQTAQAVVTAVQNALPTQGL
ncbi:MAG: S-layer homology domain-containing protein, partial [Candidatus Peribacteraceae bacterium]|nr:S-layer homology domain-containing protein [Candidatus Peribacteraceae bacterium]